LVNKKKVYEISGYFNFKSGNVMISVEEVLEKPQER